MEALKNHGLLPTVPARNMPQRVSAPSCEYYSALSVSIDAQNATDHERQAMHLMLTKENRAVETLLLVLDY